MATRQGEPCGDAQSSPQQQTSLLEIAAAPDADPEAFNLLLDAGAPVDEGWKDAGFPTAREALFKKLLERFSFPQWSDEAKVRIVSRALTDPYSGRRSQQNVGRRSGGEEGPARVLADREKGDRLVSLSEMLLEIDERDSRLNLQSFCSATQVILYRKNSGGEFNITPIRFDAAEPYPELQWGDLLWIEPDPSRKPEIRGWPNDTRWALLQHLNIPMEIKIDGRKEAITLRGDLLSYDPTTPTIPWGSAATIFRRLTGQVEGDFSVHRSGWAQPIELYIKRDEYVDADRFMLRSGDRLISRPPLDEEAAKESRLSEVKVTSPGLWFTQHFPAESALTTLTLLQSIAQTYQGSSLQKKSISPINLPELSRLGLWKAILPHPDLSRIRIRRLGEDGAEQVITVNLNEAAAACKPETTPEEARKLDMDLKPGDIVEIFPLPRQQGETWKGFSDEQTRLFTKALSFRAEFKDRGDNRLRTITFAPPQIIDTGFGLISVPLGDGSAGLMPSDYNVGKTTRDPALLTRGGKTEETRVDQIFLRDGDSVQIIAQPPQPVPSGTAPVPAPAPQGAPSGQSRPRVLPPTQR